jgi:hypothetical protein
MGAWSFTVEYQPRPGVAMPDDEQLRASIESLHDALGRYQGIVAGNAVVLFVRVGAEAGTARMPT